MCGGIVWKLDKVPKKDLQKFYTKEQIDKFNESGKGTSFFWEAQPALPIEIDNQIKLMPWGNRDDKTSKLPQTGWAKVESIRDGKWKWLHPKRVKIIAEQGYEKGKWFNVKSGGIEGLVAKLDKEERTYMITKPASESYRELFKHNREPIETKIL